MIRKWPAFALVAVALLTAACQSSDEGSLSGRIVFAGAHRLDGPVGVDGDLWILEGEVSIPENSQVTGSVYVVSGKFLLGGSVGGDVTILDGELQLGPRASVMGDLGLGGGDAEVHPEARVRGQIIQGAQLPPGLSLERPALRDQITGSLVQMLGLAALGAAAARWIPRPLHRVGRAVRDQPLVCSAVGILAGIVGLVLTIQMAFTVILIPISLLALAGLAAIVAYGWVAMGAIIGRAIQPLLGADPRPIVATALGAGLFSLMLDLLAFVPYAGALLALAAAALGMGAVLLTRFGWQAFSPSPDTDLL